MTIQRLHQLQEERARVYEQMKGILDAAAADSRALSAEEAETYDKAEKDFDAKTGEIERLERAADHARRIEKVETDPIVSAGGTGGEASNEDEYRKAFIAYVVGGIANLDGEKRGILRSGWVAPESRAQGVGTTTAGGYLIPQGFRAKLVETMKAFGAVAEVAEVINTNTGGTLPWPTNNDTGNVGALLAENTQDAEQDLTLGQATLGAYKYTSKIVRVSLELIQDLDWMDVEALLARKLGERLGRIENQHQTTGTGTSQPQGIVTGATSGVTAASGTAITADELIDLEFSVDPAYRQSPRAAYMSSDVAAKSVRKLKYTGSGEYIFTPGTNGAPDTIFNRRLVINPDMASPAINVKSVLFGDFYAGYIIRRVKDFQLIRMDERYADFFQVGFVGFSRMDARTQDTSAYKALTQAAV